MKYLIVGLGNMGDSYSFTRHNVGFQVLNNLSEEKEIAFKSLRYGEKSQYKYRGRILVLLKPSTFVNLSGKAINYWLKKEKISINNLIVLVDDIALPFGMIRIKPKGGNGGHNGLISIEETLGHQNYVRLRFGIGNEFTYGQQVDYVLGEWREEEKKELPTLYKKTEEIIESFVTIGLDRTMNEFNNKNFLVKP